MILANINTENYSLGMPEKIAKILVHVKNTDYSGVSGPIAIENENVTGRVLDMNLRPVDDSMPERTSTSSTSKSGLRVKRESDTHPKVTNTLSTPQIRITISISGTNRKGSVSLQLFPEISWSSSRMIYIGHASLPPTASLPERLSLKFVWTRFDRF